jgi:hypothetical protein
VGEDHRKVFRSPDGKIEITTNVPGFRWPTREEKIAGLLSAGLIDEAEAERLRATTAQPEEDSE